MPVLNFVHSGANSLFNSMSFDSNQDLVLITGGAGGLGTEIALEFRRRDANVVVLDISNPLPENHISGVHYYRCDISKRSDVAKTIKKIKKEVGIVTILINNAAITTGKPLIHLTFEEIEKTIQVNLLASFYTIKMLLPGMLEKNRGYIVSVSSVLGYMTPARLTVYGASKSGLLSLHESLSYELGPPAFGKTGVKTLLIAPGQMNTKLFNGVKTPSSLFAPVLEPKYVANVIVKSIVAGRRGEIKLPFYGNFLPIFRSIPWPFVQVIRKISGIDKGMLGYNDGDLETDEVSSPTLLHSDPVPIGSEQGVSIGNSGSAAVNSIASPIKMFGADEVGETIEFETSSNGVVDLNKAGVTTGINKINIHMRL